MTQLTLDGFAQVTVRVLAKDGIEKYLPTVLVGREVAVIEGIPPSVDHRQAVQDFIEAHRQGDGDVFFGVKTADNEVTVGGLTGGGATFKAVGVTAGGYAISDVPRPSWWRLGP